MVQKALVHHIIRNKISITNSIQTSTNIKSIELLDILGSHIKSFQSNTNLVEINISENPSGVYFLRISLINGNIVTKKIICK